MKNLFLFIILEFCINSLVFAQDTVIKDPNLVAPFKLCFTNDGPDSWPTVPLGRNKVVFIKPDQPLPLCLTQNLSITDYKNLTAFEKDFFVAVSMWQSYFKSFNPVNIKVVVDNSKPRFSGGSMHGASKFLETTSNKKVMVIYPSSLSTMLGDNPSHLDYDIQVTIKPLRSATYNQSKHCYDDNPTGKRSCNPQIGHDLTSVITHELGHGYGIASNRVRKEQSNYGGFFKNQMLAFDFQTNNDSQHPALLNNYGSYFIEGAHPIFFTGKSTVAYLNRQNLPSYLPICNLAKSDHNRSQNFSHFCNIDCSRPASASNIQDLMGGQWCLWTPQSQTRLNISSLDLHILYDIGYAPILKTTTADPDLRNNLFNPKSVSH